VPKKAGVTSGSLATIVIGLGTSRCMSVSDGEWCERSLNANNSPNIQTMYRR